VPAFGPLAILSLVAGVCTSGLLAFVRAHSRTRYRLRLQGQFTRVSNIPLNRTATALRASAAG
jgi:hypothetical protein